MRYQIIERDTGMSLESEKYNNLKEVQKTLNTAKKLAKKGEMLCSYKNFINTEYIVLSEKREISFIGNKRI